MRFSKQNNVLVKSKLQHPPPGQPPGIWLFWKLLFKFPPPRAKMLFKCPTLGSIRVIKCPHPGDISQAHEWQKDRKNAFSCRTKIFINTANNFEQNSRAKRRKSLLQGHWRLSFSLFVVQHTKRSIKKSHLLRLLHSIHAIHDYFTDVHHSCT